MEFQHPLVIVNPASAAGTTHRRFLQLEPRLRRLFPAMEVAVTQGPLHAVDLAAEAARDDPRRETPVDLVMAFGGDGTLNEVVTGLLSGRKAGSEPPVLAVFPSGTGGDFRRLLGLSADPEGLLACLCGGVVRPVDAGLLEYEGPAGDRVSRPFLNIASCGISGLVDRYVNSTTKVFGGRVSFFAGTLRGMLRYQNVAMRVRVDGTEFFEGPAALVAVANGRFFGGGMMIAPRAVLDDGLLDVVVLGDLGKVEFLSLSRFIYSGRHLDRPKIGTARGTQVEVASEAEALIDLDGEQVGRLPLRASVLRAAIRLLVPGPTAPFTPARGVFALHGN